MWLGCRVRGGQRGRRTIVESIGDMFVSDTRVALGLIENSNLIGHLFYAGYAGGSRRLICTQI